MLASRFIEKFRRSLSRKRKRISPSQIRLEASSFCQLRCPSCPTTSRAIHPAVGSGFLRFDAFRRLVDLNPQLRTIEISNYGEVFLNPELIHILEYAEAKRVTITIGNGANLNNVKDEVLEALVKYRVGAILCSIDGASQETYRIYRVRGDFDTVIANVRKLNAFKKKYHSDVPKLSWQFVVFGHNEHEIPVARAMANELGMQFHTKLTWDDDFSPIKDKDFVRAQTGEEATTRDEYAQMRGEKYLCRICLQLWDAPQINWDGKVLGCCRNFWGDFGGNAFSDGLEESLNNSKIAYARDMLKGYVPPRDDIPCTTCDLYEDMRLRGRFIVDR